MKCRILEYRGLQLVVERLQEGVAGDDAGGGDHVLHARLLPLEHGEKSCENLKDTGPYIDKFLESPRFLKINFYP